LPHHFFEKNNLDIQKAECFVFLPKSFCMSGSDRSAGKMPISRQLDAGVALPYTTTKMLSSCKRNTCLCIAKKKLFLLLLALVFSLVLPEVESFLFQRSFASFGRLINDDTHLRPRTNPKGNYLQATPREERSQSRRLVFEKLGTLLVVSLGTITVPQPATALKPRNEQLCGTGFFTNFQEYKCTEIGDISDEGQRTSLSATEEGAADSLLSKFNLGESSFDDDVTTVRDASGTVKGNKKADAVNMDVKGPESSQEM
jgi:hypothetical protein